MYVGITGVTGTLGKFIQAKLTTTNNHVSAFIGEIFGNYKCF